MHHLYLAHSRIRAATAIALIVGASSGFICSTAAAQGATSPAVSTPTGNPYRACTDGTSSEDRATCMKEAGAAKAEAQRGQLTDTPGAYDQNALQRCDALPASDKEACRLRIMGAGTTSGSVAGGGVIREVTTQTSTAEVTSGSPAQMPVGGGSGSGSK